MIDGYSRFYANIVQSANTTHTNMILTVSNKIGTTQGHVSIILDF
jgi:hypothetical protein